MPKKPAPDHCMSLRQAAEYLEFGKNYGPRKIIYLIAAGKIEATLEPGSTTKTKNNWCVSFRSVEKWRVAN